MEFCFYCLLFNKDLFSFYYKEKISSHKYLIKGKLFSLIKGERSQICQFFFPSSFYIIIAAFPISLFPTHSYSVIYCFEPYSIFLARFHSSNPSNRFHFRKQLNHQIKSNSLFNRLTNR